MARKEAFLALLVALALTAAGSASAAGLPAADAVRTALKAIVKEANGGFGLHMWATIVDRDNVVKLVVASGDNRGDQWPGSRIISAQKANTANSFSLPGFALSTANLYGLVQPGGSLFGLANSNPMNPDVIYDGSANNWGKGGKDPMAGKRVGGINNFGGGLALYDNTGTLLGGVGVSGDTSCTDHSVAWKLRAALMLDYVPTGFGGNATYDNIGYGTNLDAESHPTCDDIAKNITLALIKTHPIRAVVKAGRRL